MPFDKYCTLFGSINSCPKTGFQAISTAFSMALSLTFLSCLEIAAYTERGAWQTTKHSSSFGFFPIVGNLAWNCGYDIFLKILDRNSGSMWYPQSPCPGRSQQVYSSELKVKLKWEKTWKRQCVRRKNPVARHSCQLKQPQTLDPIFKHTLSDNSLLFALYVRLSCLMSPTKKLNWKTLPKMCSFIRVH